MVNKEEIHHLNNRLLELYGKLVMIKHKLDTLKKEDTSRVKSQPSQGNSKAESNTSR